MIIKINLSRFLQNQWTQFPIPKIPLIDDTLAQLVNYNNQKIHPNHYIDKL